MIAILPVYVFAQDTGGAMLHHQGGVFLNGNPAPSSSAVLHHDTIQTQQHYEAKLDTNGSSATLMEDTLVQYEDNELVLEHGTVLVSTSRSMAVRVGCVTVVPVRDEWTQFDVTDTNGNISVNAQKSDVNINVRRSNNEPAKQTRPTDKATVREGEHATREEKCGAYAHIPAEIAGKGAILNSPWAKLGGLAIIGTAACLSLCRGDDPISPSSPSGGTPVPRNPRP